MRIAFFTETFLPATDGVVTRLRNTLEELAGVGDAMLVIAPRYPDGGPDSYAGAPIYRVPGVPFPPYPRIKLSPAHPGVGRALRRFGPDLIHTVNPFILGPGGIYYARRLKVPLVASYHTNVATYARYYRLGLGVDATRWYTRQLHNRATINLCTSETTMDYLLGEGIKRVRLWPQGVDARHYHPGKASGPWRERLSGGHPSERLLLYVGRLAPEKGIERLKAVLREVSGTRLAIVGDGPARPSLERAFTGTPTVFTGLLHGEDLAAAYASADAFLFPSTTETLGIAMLEALASGLPVVAARSGASGEVVSEGESGLFYEPSSLATLVAAVRRLCSDDDLREALARGARAAAEKRDWGASTRVLRGYYEKALEER
ncbi:MAG TPA: glycosyltransferase family 1 protein [Rubrobacteraceae bacterium]|nr:glycosyltransferase family 1 protein [Rubrobacteraceae bacterium]